MIPIRYPGPFSLEAPFWIPSLILLAIYLVLFALGLWNQRQRFRLLTWRSWIVLLVLLFLIPPAHRFLVVYSQQATVMVPGPMNVVPFTSAISLPGMALVAVVAYAFGSGPGLIAALVAGLTWSRYTPLLLTDVLALASWGYLAGTFLNVRYRGDIFTVLRQPLASLTTVSFITVFLLSLSRLMAMRVWDPMQLIDFMVVLWSNELPLWVAVGILFGLILQAVALNPAWRIARQADRPSIYSRSIQARFVIISMPVVALSILFSVLAVTHRSVGLAREQALLEMRRSAVSAGEHIRQFYITGRNLVESFAQEPQLIDRDVAVREATLDVALRVVPFFRELLLVRATDEEFVISAATPNPATSVNLSSEELSALQMLDTLQMQTLETRLMELATPAGSGTYGYSIVGRVRGDAAGTGEANYYLVGRAPFDDNPEIHAALSILMGVGEGGAGFIVDDYNLIVAHPDHEQIRKVWTVGEGTSQLIDATARDTGMDSSLADGETTQGDIAYETVTSDGEHVFIYVYSLEAFPHRVIVQLPYAAVLRVAAATAGPLFIVQVVFGLILLALIPILASRVARPLNALSLAADRIARGNLSGEVDIAGEDEVARLGAAFEQMRVRLQARLNDLSLLLRISQKVSATLDLERGIVPILEGAMAETSAVMARFVIPRSGDRSPRVFAVSESSEDAVLTGVTELDRALMTVLMRRKEPLLINGAEAAQRIPYLGSVRAVAAFPVRSQNRTVAALWIGAERSDVFDEARVNFLSTLASQAAVLMENARLFQTAEGGRQRLAAILASTRDAILVVDSEGRLLLTNPAAQRLLGIDRGAVGKSMRNLGLPQPLLDVMAGQTTMARRVRRYQLAMPESMRSTVIGPEDDDAFPSVEVPLEDGRTFYASAAPIQSSEDVLMGVVVVMRDVTHFKEVDEMKSDFVATVSHDLRAPLTSMRGYTAMLSMVGELNDRQRDYMQRILEGVEQMNSLIGDLLDLRRIEAGVGIRREVCRLGLILVEAVELMRTRASAKGVDLLLEPSEGSPMVLGDRTLLRQAVSNLVDNAVKYTPSGGEVVVRLDATPMEALIAVSDTGIGIAPGDQMRLFEKFYRIKRREAGDVQGTGLGLALVKSIVERHRGHVWVESVLNKGSTFYISLPLDDAETSGAGQS